MAKSLSYFGLSCYLELLKDKEFTKYKELLQKEIQNFKLKPIAKSKLAEASTTSLVKLMEEKYSERQAWDMTLNIFLMMDKRPLWEQAKKQLRNIMNPYKKHMKEKFHLIWERETCLPGPDTFYKGTIKREHRALEKAYLSEANRGPLTVVLRGPEGIGKTTFLRKVMLEWAEGKLWNDRFTFVFFLDARELNLVAETSLVEFLSRDWPETSEPIEDIFSQPQDILFIIDAIEEFKLSLMVESETWDWKEQQPTQVILSGLLQGKMLPGCSVIVAMGPTCFNKYRYLLERPKQIVLRGLSMQERKRYISHFFQENPAVTESSFIKNICSLAAEGIWNQTFLFCQKDLRRNGVSESDVVLWLGIDILRRRGDYVMFVHRLVQGFCAAIFCSLAHPKSRPSRVVERIGELAIAGLWQVHPYFPQIRLFMFGLSTAAMRNKLEAIGVKLSLQTQQGLFRYLNSLKYREFLDLNFISLFCSLYEAKDDEFTMKVMDVFLDIFVHIEDSRGLVVSSYCLTLIRKLKRLSLFIENLFADDVHAPTKKKRNTSWQNICSVFRTSGDLEEVQLDHCSFSGEAMKDFCKALEQPMCQLQTIVLRFVSGFGDGRKFFKAICRNPFLRCLKLYGVSLSPTAVKELCKALKHSGCNINKLLLKGCLLTSDCCDEIASVLINNQTLKVLKLGNNDILDAGVKRLCVGLKHPNCHLNHLALDMCGLTADCIKDLASALTTCKKMNILNLDGIALDYDGVATLCKALAHPNCVLEILG
ncbi:NACHT, LRR and PYD domains-containing protein 9-like [Rhynchocyon petersi]